MWGEFNSLKFAFDDYNSTLKNSRKNSEYLKIS